MKIFDIDGTLTLLFEKDQDRTGLPTYAFWDLLSYAFAEDVAALKQLVSVWNDPKTDKGIGDAFIHSSHQMLQNSITLFRHGVTAQAVREQAKQYTLRLLEGGAVRSEAIEYLRKCLEQGELCILSTGSYQDGAYGFVDALVAQGLLPEDAAEKLIISGAEIHWEALEVQHANVAENKIIGIERHLSSRGLSFDHTEITGIYIDDPIGNDKGLFSLKPSAAYVIETFKNKHLKETSNIRLTNWFEIRQQPLTFLQTQAQQEQPNTLTFDM